jgi:hypothetical protein
VCCYHYDIKPLRHVDQQFEGLGVEEPPQGLDPADQYHKLFLVGRSCEKTGRFLKKSVQNANPQKTKKQ